MLRTSSRRMSTEQANHTVRAKCPLVVWYMVQCPRGVVYYFLLTHMELINIGFTLTTRLTTRRSVSGLSGVLSISGLLCTFPSVQEVMSELFDLTLVISFRFQIMLELANSLSFRWQVWTGKQD
jgi:hypothetical protein